MIFWVSSFCAAWTPCCASHASSALTAWSWRPLMPPAVLMSATASSPAFRIAMPGSAYGPVKGPVIPTLIGPELLALLLPLPQAAINSAPQAARLAARNRRLNIVPPYPCVVAHRHLPVAAGRECAGGRPLLHGTGPSIGTPYLSVKVGAGVDRLAGRLGEDASETPLEPDAPSLRPASCPRRTARARRIQPCPPGPGASPRRRSGVRPPRPPAPA